MGSVIEEVRDGHPERMIARVAVRGVVLDRRREPFGGEPSTSHPGYRTWIHSMIEDQVRNHDLDGFMWCNERNSPLDTLIQGGAPGDFSPDSRREAAERGVNVEACRQAPPSGFCR